MFRHEGCEPFPAIIEVRCKKSKRWPDAAPGDTQRTPRQPGSHIAVKKSAVWVVGMQTQGRGDPEDVVGGLVRGG
jgi:hypothetical protein